MISLLSKVNIIDNSGATIGQCIKILRPVKKWASIGDLILISVKKTVTSGLGNTKEKVQKGEVHKALIVRTVYPSNSVKWDDNAVVLVKTTPKNFDLTPLGSRIKGPIDSNLKYKKGCQKILALAKYSV